MNIKPMLFYSVIGSTAFLYGCGGSEQNSDTSSEPSWEITGRYSLLKLKQENQDAKTYALSVI